MNVRQQLHGRELTVAGGGEILEDDVPGLLAAEDVILQQHFFQHITVADLGRCKTDVVRLAEADEAEVGHDRADHGVVLQSVARLHVQRKDRHDHIAVHDLTVPVHAEHAVRVTVKGDADVQLLFLDAGDQVFEVGRAAGCVDVGAVRFVGEHHALDTERGEQLFRRAGGRAVRAVERDGQPVEAFGRRRGDKSDVFVDCFRLMNDFADLGAGRRLRHRHFAEHHRLDVFLQLVGELEAVGVEDLDAVEFKRVVRRRDHDARARLVAAGEVGDGRGRHHAEIDDIIADRKNTCGQRRGKHIRGNACVHAEQNGLFGIAFALCHADGGGNGVPGGNRQLNRELLVGNAADAVCSEESSHRDLPFVYLFSLRTMLSADL